jgi:SLT domain-containing protein
VTDLAAGEIVRVRSPQYLINLSPEITERWKATKNVLNQGVDSIANSKQQFSESLKATASKQTGEVVDTVINTFQKVKDSVDETLQSAEQIKNTTSSALQTVVTDSVNNWLTQHPGFLPSFISWFGLLVTRLSL